MVYIPFPRTDLDNHSDLVEWRNRNVKREGDWTALKDFLAEHPRILSEYHSTPKCWYTELPQGDDFALDVEHFRPKNQAAPLTGKQVEIFEKRSSEIFRQENGTGDYSWLEFDYRNYRLTTAIPNRGGAKHIYFPIAESTQRLRRGEFPWQQLEYPYLLDPTNPHDATLLLVLPDGKIAPRSPKVSLSDADFANLPHSWHSDGFNYIRASATIQLYRLEEKIFEKGRKEVYDKVNELMERLLLCIQTGADPRLKDGFIKDLIVAVLPSAPFSLAARCALEAYVPPMGIADDFSQVLSQIPRQILDKITAEIANYPCSWENP